MTLSTHVLDTTTGRPAAGVAVCVEQRVGGQWGHVAEGCTDADGRIGALGSTGAGVFRIAFDSGSYFAARQVATFYPEVSVTFEIVDAGAHHHLPLLLGPFAYSTYRGS